MSTYNGVNVNPLSILNDFKQYHNQTLLLLIGNIFAYFPLGIYIKYKTNIRTIKLLSFFLPYIILIEILQYNFKCGICDINDIIFNTSGFLLGAVVYNLILYYSKQKKLNLSFSSTQDTKRQ
jgi:glycopeptide antibiotics resistance protein